MSRIYDAFKTPDQEPDQSWYLKTSDETVYGPVDLSTLATWAKQNRIAPGNKVSTDQNDWLPVDTLSELEMIWTLALITGQPYGPIHLMAASSLVRQGAVSPDAVLTNRLTGEELNVRTLLEEEQRQLPLDDFLNKAAGYHEPSDKPSQTHPVETDAPPAPAPSPSAETPAPGPDPASNVSQMALQLSGFVHSRTAGPPASRPGPREIFRSMLFFRRSEKRINRRLTRKVQKLQEELLFERRRLLKLHEELFGSGPNGRLDPAEEADGDSADLAGATVDRDSAGSPPLA